MANDNLNKLKELKRNMVSAWGERLNLVSGIAALIKRSREERNPGLINTEEKAVAYVMKNKNKVTFTLKKMIGNATELSGTEYSKVAEIIINNLSNQLTLLDSFVEVVEQINSGENLSKSEIGTLDSLITTIVDGISQEESVLMPQIEKSLKKAA